MDVGSGVITMMPIGEQADDARHWAPCAHGESRPAPPRKMCRFALASGFAMPQPFARVYRTAKFTNSVYLSLSA
jgi:hypothetical protein